MVNSFNCPTNGSSSHSNQEPATAAAAAGPSGLNMASMANFNNPGEGGDANSAQQMHQPMSIDDQKTVKLEVLEDFFGSGWDDDVSGHLATGGPLLAASPPMANTPSPPIEHFLPTLTPRPPPPLHQAPGASQGGSSSSLLMANVHGASAVPLTHHTPGAG